MLKCSYSNVRAGHDGSRLGALVTDALHEADDASMSWLPIGGALAGVTWLSRPVGFSPIQWMGSAIALVVHEAVLVTGRLLLSRAGRTSRPSPHPAQESADSQHVGDPVLGSAACHDLGAGLAQSGADRAGKRWSGLPEEGSQGDDVRREPHRRRRGAASVARPASW